MMTNMQRTIAIIIIIAIIVSIVLLIMQEVYGIFFSSQRRFIRYNAFYTKEFWRSFTDTHPEGPFRIIGCIPESPPLTDKVIVYSLYGTDTTRYFDPLYRNITSCQDALTGWHFRIYIHDQCQHWINQLKKCSNVQLFVVDDTHVFPGNSAGAFWRFLPLCEPIDAIILDSDDDIDPKMLLDTWDKLQSTDAVLSVSQCTPWPSTYIQGKLIFKKRSARPYFSAEDIQTYQHRSTFGSDEVFTTLELSPALEGQGIIRRQSFINKIFARAVVGRGLLS